LQGQDPQVRIDRARRAQRFQAAVARAVVYGDDLVRPRLAGERLGELVEQDGDVLFLVEDGKDDRQVHQRGSITPNAASKFAAVWAATASSESPHNDASSSA